MSPPATGSTFPTVRTTFRRADSLFLLAVAVQLGLSLTFGPPAVALANSAVAAAWAGFAIRRRLFADRLDWFRIAHTPPRPPVEVRPAIDMGQAVFEAQRLESLGVMAGGIAHEFSNLLTVVGGHIELAADTLAADSPAVQMLDPAARAARKAGDLCRQMQAFAGQSLGEPTTIDLNALVTESSDLYRCAVPADALSVEPAADTPVVAGDAAALRQVLLNLVSNAGEAVAGHRGRVVVRTGTAGDHAWLEVADDGPGIPAEVQRKVFDPFYSTKFAGRGMGLAVVHGIVARHGGRIDLRSTPTTGTTVRVVLPAERRAVPAFHPSFDSNVARVGSRT